MLPLPSGFKLFLDSDRAITSTPGPLHAGTTMEYLKIMERTGQKTIGPYLAFLQIAGLQDEQQAVQQGLPSLSDFKNTLVRVVCSTLLSHLGPEHSRTV